MNVRRYILPGIAALSLVCVCSCKKDENEESLYLDGVPEFSLPAYGEAGDVFEFTAKGVRNSDNTEIGYFWYTKPSISTRDTTIVYRITLPDTLCNVTLTCSAFAKGYYNSSTSKTISIVSPDRENGSLQGILFDITKDFIFTDPRDGFEYRCTTVGGKDWFKDNLSYKQAGRPLENCKATANLFGHLYTWEEAKDACPEGWRVSTLQDWADAAKEASGKDFDPKATFTGVAGDFLCEATINGEDMWEYSKNVRITNKLRLCALPLGFVNIGSLKDSFESIYEYAAFWAADQKDTDQAYYRYIYFDQNDVLLGSADKKSFGASVRCVRDHE